MTITVRIKVELTVPVFLPVLGQIRERAAELERMRVAPAIQNDLRTLLDLFAPDFEYMGYIQIERREVPAVLRACSFLRLDLRREKLFGVSDETIEEGSGLDPRTPSGAIQPDVMAFLAVGTLLDVVLASFAHLPAPPGGAPGVVSRIRSWFSPPRAISPSTGEKSEVVVLNDPVNTMGYVTRVFQIVLGLSEEVAAQRMNEVHAQKLSRVWTGSREQAEAYARELQAWHLCTEVRPVGA